MGTLCGCSARVAHFGPLGLPSYEMVLQSPEEEALPTPSLFSPGLWLPAPSFSACPLRVTSFALISACIPSCCPCWFSLGPRGLRCPDRCCQHIQHVPLASLVSSQLFDQSGEISERSGSQIPPDRLSRKVRCVALPEWLWLSTSPASLPICPG